VDRAEPWRLQKKSGMTKWVVLAAIIVVICAGLALLCQPVWQVKHTEQELLDKFGETAVFVPSADGSIPSERIEAFLQVREQVHVFCGEFQNRIGELYEIGVFEGNEDPSKPVNVREGMGDLKKIFGFGPAFLRFINTRNRALLDQEMGLGEYFYIYCLAYQEELLRTDESRFANIDLAYVGSRVRHELVHILENQLAVVNSGADSSVDPKFGAELQNQIAAIKSERQALPWEEDLPPQIAASLEPYAEQLTRLYCEGITKIELMQKNENFNFGN
jgi:hypothetical protein